MRAAVGDRLCVHGRIVGQHDRTGEILEVGPDNQPPFLVRFEDGHERLMYPGPDCEVVSTGE